MFQYSHWMKLPIITRYKIAEAFGIEKKKSTHVANDQIVDDGFYIQDVESALTVESMRTFTGIESDNIEILWQAMVDKIEGKEVEVPEPVQEPIQEVKEEIVQEIKEEIIEKKNAKIKKTK
jgi:hypothetical protein